MSWASRMWKVWEQEHKHSLCLLQVQCLLCLLRFIRGWYLLMTEITVMLSCQPHLCILPGGKWGCTCHCRKVTQEVKRAKELVSWPRIITVVEKQVTNCTQIKKYKIILQFFQGELCQFWHKFHYLVLSTAVKDVAHRWEGEKIQPLERSLVFLLVVYLFIYFCWISSLSLSKVRGTTKECVSSKQGKINTSSSYRVDWATVHLLFWTVFSLL